MTKLSKILENYDDDPDMTSLTPTLMKSQSKKIGKSNKIEKQKSIGMTGLMS